MGHVYKLLILVVLCFFTGCSAFEIDDAGSRGGYIYGNLEHGSLGGAQAAIYADVNINPLLGMPEKYGKLQTVFEAYGGPIFMPESGFLTGASGFIRYMYIFNDQWQVFIEGGAGPAYFGLDTYEQGDEGFNFNDQIGFGIRYRPFESVFTFCYRFSHISHAGVRDSNNRGIEFHYFGLGFSF